MEECQEEETRNSSLTKLLALVSDDFSVDHVISDDVILGGFVYSLDTLSARNSLVALKVLTKLVKHVESRPRLYKFTGMMQQLKKLKEHQNPEVRELAVSIYAILIKSSEDNEENTNSRSSSNEGSTSCRKPLGDISVNTSHETAIITPKRKRRNSMAVKKNNLSSKSVTLQIKGMNNKDDLESCRNVLMEVKGVISLYFVYAKKRVVLRVKPELTVEVLAKAVKKNFMSAERVVKDDEGVEFLEPINVSFIDPLPDYDDDEDISLVEDNPHQAIKRLSPPEKKSWGWGLLSAIGEEVVKLF